MRVNNFFERPLGGGTKTLAIGQVMVIEVEEEQSTSPNIGKLRNLGNQISNVFELSSAHPLEKHCVCIHDL